MVRPRLSRTWRLACWAVAACTIAGALSANPADAAGPYSAHSNDPGNAYDAPIQATDPRIVAWASSVSAYAPAPGVDSGFDVAANALGEPDDVIVALGDLDATQITEGVPPGALTLEFANPIFNGVGHDFAVFENGFTFFDDPAQVFAELAYVEVSTNGVDFARFESISLQTEGNLHTPFGRDFAGVDPTNYYNLAGKHVAGWGTPFDLDELSEHALVVDGLLDLNDVRYVRIVDIPGNGAFTDALGNPIYDTWLMAGSGGIDVDAVGAIHVLPEPASLALVALGMLAMARNRR